MAKQTHSVERRYILRIIEDRIAENVRRRKTLDSSPENTSAEHTQLSMIENELRSLKTEIENA